ncbi:MAG: hypothetical protein ABH827_00550 [bacterium]
MKNVRKILAIALMAILGLSHINAAPSDFSAAGNVTPEEMRNAALKTLKEAATQHNTATKGTMPKETGIAANQTSAKKITPKQAVKKAVDLDAKRSAISRYVLIGSAVIATATVATVAALVGFYVKNNTNRSFSDFFGWIARGLHAVKTPKLNSYINYIDNKSTAFDAFYGPNKMSPKPAPVIPEIVTPVAPVINTAICPRQGNDMADAFSYPAETNEEIAQNYAQCDGNDDDCIKTWGDRCTNADITKECDAAAEKVYIQREQERNLEICNQKRKAFNSFWLKENTSIDFCSKPENAKAHIEVLDNIQNSIDNYYKDAEEALSSTFTENIKKLAGKNDNKSNLERANLEVNYDRSLRILQDGKNSNKIVLIP